VGEMCKLNKTALKHTSILDKLVYAQSLIKDSNGLLNNLVIVNRKNKPFIEVVTDKLGKFHYYCVNSGKCITKLILKAQRVDYYEMSLLTTPASIDSSNRRGEFQIS
jgi:hypothetical protein